MNLEESIDRLEHVLRDLPAFRYGDKVFMTGQGWYDRFWQEYETELPKVIDATIIREQVDRVAREAAGITEPTEILAADPSDMWPEIK